MMRPLRLAAFAMDGSGAALPDTLATLTDVVQRIPLGRFTARPALSVNRGFSAPVIVDYERAPGELAWLAAHDDDPFARYEALQQRSDEHTSELQSLMRLSYAVFCLK